MLLFWDKRFCRDRGVEIRLTYSLFTKFSRKGASPPDFRRSGNPISTWEGRLCPSHYYSPPPDFQTCRHPWIRTERETPPKWEYWAYRPATETYAATLGQTFSPRPTGRAPFNLLSFHEIFAHKDQCAKPLPNGSTEPMLLFLGQTFSPQPTPSFSV